jgi:RNA polymerase sigma-70 factor (ECF subfamily)
MSKEQQSEQLIRQIRAGKRSAMDQLMKLWYQPIVHYAWRFTGDRHAAEEIGQNTFLKVFRKLHQLKDISSFHIWLYRIADNQCKDHLRRKKKFVSLDQEAIPEKGSSKGNAQHLLEQEEQTKWIKKALLQLPEDQRIVIVMKEYQGLKFREIAAILDLSENTVKSRMYAGLRALKKSLIRHPYKRAL